MSRARRIEDLKPFLPGLEAVLEDPEVSELMINGPCNVWVERKGRLRPHSAPDLTEHVLDRAAIQIARPLELDPRQTSIIDARLEDGSRVAISVPPASPATAITVRRFGNRSFSAQDLVRMGSLPEEVLVKAQDLLRSRRNILVSGGTGSGKTTLLNALIELLPQDERIVSIEDTLELKITRLNSLRFEASQLDGNNGKGKVTIRDLVRPRPSSPARSHCRRRSQRGRSPPTCCKPSTPGTERSLTTIHANNAEAALSRLANCAMQDGGALPWEVTCRNVVDGIAMVIHLTRRDGKRFVEDAIEVGGYDSGKKRFTFTLVPFR